MTFETAFRTDSPRDLAFSEDQLAVHQLSSGGVVVVVADGAGGASGGRRAAELSLGLVERALARPGFDPFSARSWRDLLVEADDEIERDRAAGETTAVIAAVNAGGVLVGASVGDSGALVIGADGAVDDLTAGQHRKRRLGSGQAMPVAFERLVLDGTTVVATDGLLMYSTPASISQVILRSQSVEQAAENLVRLARLPSGHLADDVAVVVLTRTS